MKRILKQQPGLQFFTDYKQLVARPKIRKNLDIKLKELPIFWFLFCQLAGSNLIAKQQWKQIKRFLQNILYLLIDENRYIILRKRS
jgi:hypothetical protein